MSYNFNSIPNISPAGTVIQYASPTVPTDPPGWVICDGIQRDNGATNSVNLGKYNNLITLGFVNKNQTSTTNGVYYPLTIATTTSVDGITIYSIMKT